MAQAPAKKQSDEAAHERQIAADLFTPPQWRGRHAGPFAPMRMGSIGVKRSWPLLLAVTIGMLTAVTLMATVPLYSSLVADVHVQRVLAANVTADNNIEIVARTFFASKDTGDDADQRVAQVVSSTMGPLVSPLNSYLSVPSKMALNSLNDRTIKLNDPNSPFFPGSNTLLYAFDFQTAQPHMHIFAGSLPHDPVDGQVPEVLITNRMDTARVGDTLTFTPPGGKSAGVTVRVAGIWYPTDSNDPYWNGAGYDTHVPTGDVGDSSPPTYPLVMTPATLYLLMSTPLSGIRTGQQSVLRHYVYATQIYHLRASGLDTAVTSLKTLRTRIPAEVSGRDNIFSTDVGTKLDKTVAGLQQDLKLLTLPLYVIVLQVIFLALLFVVAMAGLLIESQASELATLRSRGASSSQVLLGYTLQGLLLAVVVAFAGPFLARELSYRLVSAMVPFTAQLNATHSGTLYLTQAIALRDAAFPAVLGALLGVGALVVAALRSSRIEVLALRREQGRETRVPFWRRYYLDIGLALVAVASFLELTIFGGLSVRAGLVDTSSGGADPTLLAAPALLLVAGSLLMLRIFPLGASLGAWLASLRRGATAMLAFSQVDRARSTFSRLVLLLTLSVGMAAFALNFQSTLAANARDRAAYVVGADERLFASDEGSSDTAVVPQLMKLPGVRGVAAAYRTDAGAADATVESSMLAVDSGTFTSVAKWRSDEASQPLSALMGQMKAHLQGIQAGDLAHPLWALVDTNFVSAFHVKVGDHFDRIPNGEQHPAEFIVGGIVNSFPTLYNVHGGGVFVVDVHDYLSAVSNSNAIGGVGVFPNEYWVSLSDFSAATTHARLQGYQAETLSILSVTQRAPLEAQFVTSPVAAGMTGLLLLGAFTAAALGVLGSLAQAVYGARARLRQFAILRTLGMGRGQLTRMLLSEQALVYSFALVGGSALGLALTFATIPFLQFNLDSGSIAEAGIPPYVIAPNTVGLTIYYAALVVAFALALALGGRIARGTGLGRTLRIGED